MNITCRPDHTPGFSLQNYEKNLESQSLYLTFLREIWKINLKFAVIMPLLYLFQMHPGAITCVLY